VAGSSFGRLFRITTAGESHGAANIVIVEGCPAGLPLSVDDLLPDLERRRPGQSELVSQRKEPDEPTILSGVFEGKTTGTPIAIVVHNADARARDYTAIKDLYRPGHADHTTTRSTAFGTTAAAVAPARARRCRGSPRGRSRRS
jgi:chorismate synthase